MVVSVERLCFICAILLELIPGVSCYDYNVGGLVAAAVIGAFCFAAIILMIIIAIFWRDWYMKRMLRQGRSRIPREKWNLIFGRNKRTQNQSLMSTPRSERRANLMMHEFKHGMPGSRVTTLSRGRELPADAWLTQLPASTNQVEEKTRTMRFEPEEEAIIVADVLPDQEKTTHFTSTNLRTSNGPAYVVTSSAPTDATTSQQRTSYQTTSQNSTVYVPYRETNPKTSAYLSKTTTEPASSKPYHVKVSQISQTTRPEMMTQQAGGKDDIFISPLIPQSSAVDRDQGKTAVLSFDSDDEAGNIPNKQAEDSILF